MDNPVDNLLRLTNSPRQSEFLRSVILIPASRVEQVEEGCVPAVPQAHRLPAEPSLGALLPPVGPLVGQGELDGGAHGEVGEGVADDGREGRAEVDAVDGRGRDGADDAAAGEACIGLKQ